MQGRMKSQYSRLLFVTLVMCGCGSDSALEPIPLPANVYWELRLNHHAVLLSLREPHNTLQLQAIPYTGFNEVWNSGTATPAQTDSILDVSPAEFVSRDSSKVLVSSTGLVTARAVQTGDVYVVARRKLGNSIHVDSALIRVMDVVSPPALDTFRVRPRDGDSAKVAVSVGFPARKSFVVTTKDTEGSEMMNVPVYFSSPNPLVASVANRFAAAKSIEAVRPGRVMLMAETWVYGVEKQDTFSFTVGYPVVFSFYGVLSIQKDGVLPTREWHVGPGATLQWRNNAGRSVDVIFEDSLNVLPTLSNAPNSGGGNILEIPGDTTLFFSERDRYRRLLTPGTYIYRVHPFNTVGKIIVHDM